ncbi:MAG TPA: hypothetical protein VF594_10435 [Rubricoccaceae bacterium]|jgi:hypothetical protein
MIRWRVWTSTKTEEKARLVLHRLLSDFPTEPLGLVVEPYPKTDGHRLTFSTASAAERWSDLISEALTLAEVVGHEWQLTGSAASDLGGWSNKPSAAGAVSVSWEAERGELL